MELLTTSAPIIEQDNHGCKTVGIPKAYIKRRGLIRKDVLYATIEKDGKGISITYSEYLRKDSIKRSILESGGYYRIVLPKSDLHKKGNRWDVYTNNNGLLRYELLN